MKRGLPELNKGFTIIETLIVLAIAGAMLFSATLVIGGRQRNTEFSQGIRQIQGQIQQTINEVSNGYYASNENIKCVTGSNGPVLSVAAKARGTNDGCIFFGKAIQFGINGTNPQEYNVYTVAGLQGSEDSADATLAPIKPVLAAKSNNAATSTFPDFYENLNMPYGMTISKVYYGSDPSVAAKQVGFIGFVSSIGNFGGGDISQQVNVLAIPGTQINQTKLNGVTDANTKLTTSIVNPTDGVRVCVNSGGTNQSGLFIIGGEGSGSAITLSIKGGKDCP